MNQDIPQASDLVPFDLRILRLEIFGKTLGLFGEHLQITKHGVLHDGLFHKYGEIQAGY